MTGRGGGKRWMMRVPMRKQLYMVNLTLKRAISKVRGREAAEWDRLLERLASSTCWRNLLQTRKDRDPVKEKRPSTHLADLRTRGIECLAKQRTAWLKYSKMKSWHPIGYIPAPSQHLSFACRILVRTQYILVVCSRLIQRA